MASQGPNFPTTVTNPGANWTNPGYVQQADGSYAECSSIDENPILTMGYGFTVPVGATINGITLTLYGHSNDGTFSQMSAQLIIGGVSVGSTLTTAGAYPPAIFDALDTIGGASNLWGLTPSVAQINASDFGVQIQLVGGSADVGYLDYVTLTITYTPVIIPSPPLSQQGVYLGRRRFP